MSAQVQPDESGGENVTAATAAPGEIPRKLVDPLAAGKTPWGHVSAHRETWLLLPWGHASAAAKEKLGNVDGEDAAETPEQERARKLLQYASTSKLMHLTLSELERLRPILGQFEAGD